MPANRCSYRNILLLMIMTPAACGDPAPDCFPLGTDGHWQYHTIREKLDKIIRQQYIVANAGRLDIGDMPVFVRRAANGSRQYYRRVETGIQRVGEQLQPELYEQAVTILPLPLSIGNHWQTRSDVRLIESKTFEMRDRLHLQKPEVTLNYTIMSLTETVAVPAGTYHRCLLVQGTGQTKVKVNRGNTDAVINVESLRWYAPDVGLVKAGRHETSGSVFLKPGHYRMELESFRR